MSMSGPFAGLPESLQPRGGRDLPFRDPQNRSMSRRKILFRSRWGRLVEHAGEHGTTALYMAGCSCRKCLAAHRDYSRQYRPRSPSVGLRVQVSRDDMEIIRRVAEDRGVSIGQFVREALTFVLYGEYDDAAFQWPEVSGEPETPQPFVPPAASPSRGERGEPREDET